MPHRQHRLPNPSRTCTGWLPTRPHWAAVCPSRRDTLVQSMTTTPCRATVALPTPICRAALFMLEVTLLIPCQLLVLCSMWVIFLTRHLPVWTTAALPRFQATITMDLVTPIPPTQTYLLIIRLREGCKKPPNWRICNLQEGREREKERS